jgi:hypothetical protein
MGAPVQRGGLPPRRGAVKALTVDSTARSYNIIKLALGDYTPDGTASVPAEVDVWFQADTNDVFIHFRNDSGAADLDNAGVAAADGAAMTSYTNTHGAVLEAGESPICFRLNRGVDKYMVVKAASTSGTLRFWAASGTDL